MSYMPSPFSLSFTKPYACREWVTCCTLASSWVNQVMSFVAAYLQGTHVDVCVNAKDGRIQCMRTVAISPLATYEVANNLQASVEGGCLG
jgi:hypothetical protein